MTLATNQDLALAPGSLVVVSGVTGNIASHVVDQLLIAGMRVRGTVRSLSRGQWVADLFNERYGPNKVELAEVQDMSSPGAFNEAVKGAQGFVHVATPVMQSPDPNKAINPVVDGMLNVLRACALEEGITRVVITSSSTAAASPQPNKEFTIDSNTWNDKVVADAWLPPPYEGLQRTVDVYGASKMQSEQAAWRWMKEQQPPPRFVLNAVLPNANFGAIVSSDHQQYHSTLGWIRAAWDDFEGSDEARQIRDQLPQYYIDIVDDAKVHVAALLLPEVKGERLFAFAHPYNWNDVLAVFRKLKPNHPGHKDIPGLGHDLSKVANGRAEELLKKLYGHGWTSLEDSIKQAIEGYA